MKPIRHHLAASVQLVARGLVILLFTGCQTPPPSAKAPVRPVRPAVVEVAPETADAPAQTAFFVVRSLDQDGTRENARREPVVTYHLRFQLPEFTGPIFRGLNHIIQTFALETRKDFVQSTMDIEVDQLDTAGFPWTLEVKFKLVYATPRFISLLFTRTLHTGGTQFSTDFYTINYDLEYNKDLQLPELLANAMAFNSLSSLVINRLRQQSNLVTDPRLLQSGAGPVPENYASFTLSPEGLSVQFVAGQVADVSNGPLYVDLPFTLITSLLRPEVMVWFKARPQ